MKAFAWRVVDVVAWPWNAVTRLLGCDPRFVVIDAVAGALEWVLATVSRLLGLDALAARHHRRRAREYAELAVQLRAVGLPDAASSMEIAAAVRAVRPSLTTDELNRRVVAWAAGDVGAR